MRRTNAVRPSTIVLVVLALLASSAVLAVRSPSEARALLAAATFVPGTSSVERAHELSSHSDGVPRTAFIRPTSPSITRSTARISARSADARGAVALAAPLPSLARVTFRAPATADVRRDGVPSPGQPAPAARAPPIG